MNELNRKLRPKLAGVELYFSDLKRARDFYANVVGLHVVEEDTTRYTKFDGGASFLCLEREGSEPYPLQDKAALFLEVQDLQAAIDAIGKDRIVQREAAWAVLRDPEGHNILLLER